MPKSCFQYSACVCINSTACSLTVSSSGSGFFFSLSPVDVLSTNVFHLFKVKCPDDRRKEQYLVNPDIIFKLCWQNQNKHLNKWYSGLYIYVYIMNPLFAKFIVSRPHCCTGVVIKKHHNFLHPLMFVHCFDLPNLWDFFSPP